MDAEQLIETWRAAIVALHAGMGAPWADAQELAMDTLVEAYIGRARLRGDPDDPVVVGPWLRGIARHLHYKWRRGRSRSLAHHELDEGAPLRAPAGSPGTETDERGEALRDEMRRLPEDLRTVLYMRYLEDTPVRDVAAVLGLTEKTVEGRLYRARKLLRERLGNLSK